MTSQFHPTYLYIKQHKLTGLKYFGKTTKAEPDMLAYRGSGVYWRRHLKIHGYYVDTLWYELFSDRNYLIEYALKFSIDNNIVESDEWANLIIENGMDGVVIGHKHTNESRIKMSIANKGVSRSLGRVLTEETKNKISVSQIGKKRGKYNKSKIS